MNLSDAIRRRRDDEYAALRDQDPVEYQKCAALASHFASRIERGVEDALSIGVDVEAALIAKPERWAEIERGLAE